MAKELIWGPRPPNLACSVNGCGRKPLCGFADAEGTVFHCAACVSDDSGEVRTRTVAERTAILEFKW